MNEDASEMPRYQCHKKVWALKISAIEDHPGEGFALLKTDEPGYGTWKVYGEYMNRFDPKVGGYLAKHNLQAIIDKTLKDYVVYDDGYKSFSPAKAFEEGYARV